jgi:hypothetical protein
MSSDTWVDHLGTYHSGQHTHVYTTYESNIGQHWQVCIVPGCGHTTSKQFHNLVDDHVRVPATCSRTGVMVRVCTVCGAKFNQPIPKLKHTEVEDLAVAATCTSTGLTAGSHCSVCNAVIEAQKVTEKLLHNVVLD